MFESDFRFINEEFYADEISPRQLDALLAGGWRNFGEHFFRYNLGFYEDEIRLVIPLRVRLADFTFSKSQRRVLNKNRDLQIHIRPVLLDDEKHELFDRHKQRFKSGVPDSLYTFLAYDAANMPCQALEFAVYHKDLLIGVSFSNLGADSLSSIYAMFEPSETSRSLGILTMLLEIEFAVKSGKAFYYPGYAYQGNSFYDYKKRFRGLEKYDWRGNWEKFGEEN